MRKKIRYHFQFEKYFLTSTDGFGAGSPKVSEKPDPEKIVPTYICGKRFTQPSYFAANCCTRTFLYLLSGDVTSGRD
jgi:hypothetical protein